MNTQTAMVFDDNTKVQKNQDFLKKAQPTGFLVLLSCSDFFI